MSIEYRDVLVRIEGSDGNYEVSLHHFPLPQDGGLSPIVCVRTSLDSIEARRLKRLIGDLIGKLPPKNTLKETGKLLRKLLFPDDVWTTFCAILEHAETEGKHGRIRLLVEADELSSCPWEAVFIEEWNSCWGSFLVLDDVVSLTRLLPGEAPLVPLASVEKLRVLLIGCSLDDTSAKLAPLPQVATELKTLRNVPAKLAAEGLVYAEDLLNPTKLLIDLLLGHTRGMPPGGHRERQPACQGCVSRAEVCMAKGSPARTLPV